MEEPTGRSQLGGVSFKSEYFGTSVGLYGTTDNERFCSFSILFNFGVYFSEFSKIY